MSARSRYAPWFHRRRTLEDIRRAGCITFGLDDFEYDPMLQKMLAEERASRAFQEALRRYYEGTNPSARKKRR